MSDTSKREAVAKALDALGVTVVYADDPVDGSRIQVVHLDDLARIGDVFEQAHTPTTEEIAEWEYGRRYVDEGGSPHVRPASNYRGGTESPDGHRADGSPYWNYTRVRRRKAGPWMPVEGEAG